MQDSSTSQLVFKTEAIIEWVSRCVTLQPGDLIFTGTPPGVGCFRKPTPIWCVDCGRSCPLMPSAQARARASVARASLAPACFAIAAAR